MFGAFRPALMVSANCCTDGAAEAGPVAPMVMPTAAAIDRQATAARRTRIEVMVMGLPGVCGFRGPCEGPHTMGSQ
ncbi:hypothetical protein GCM10009722_15600 [Williamsia deligens]